MDNQTTLEKLSEKITQIIQRYDALKNENEAMRNELVTLKSEKEIKDHEIARLSEENALKDIEIEEIVSKIESILG